MVDQGLYCRLAEYGRGAGYPWQFGDPFDNSGMIRRCEADHGRRGCEMWGAVAYPKCRSGFSPFGCCICRPNPPNCAALGMGHQIDLSCAKRITIGDPIIRTGCAGGKVYDAGLCYPPCNTGFHGVGPVCWGQPPTGWNDCGMGAAEDSGECAEVIVGQVVSVFDLSLNLVTFGAGGAISKGTTAYSRLVADFNSLKQDLRNLLARYPEIQDSIDAGSTVLTARDLATMDSLSEPEDIIRMTAQIASLFDPTGIAGAIAAFSYPTCDRIVISPAPTSGPSQLPTPEPTPVPSTRTPTYAPSVSLSTTPSRLSSGEPTEVSSVTPTQQPSVADPCPCAWWQMVCRATNGCFFGFSQ